MSNALFNAIFNDSKTHFETNRSLRSNPFILNNTRQGFFNFFALNSDIILLNVSRFRFRPNKGAGALIALVPSIVGGALSITFPIPKFS